MSLLVLEGAQFPPEVLRVVRRSNWECSRSHFADVRHRLRIADLLCSIPGSGPLTVLGAGNANSLDLGLLLRRFPQIFLVDLDRSAVTQAARDAAIAGLGAVVTFAPVDLSGLLSKLSDWVLQPPTDDDLLEAVDRAQRRVRCMMPDSEVVLSDCWLRQSADLLQVGAGNRAWLPRARKMLLRGHLSSLLRWPGCEHAVLLSEVCAMRSSSNATGPDAEVPTLGRLAEWSRQGLLFEMGDPFKAADQVKGDTHQAHWQTRVLEPWGWSLPSGEAYCVSGLRLCRET